MYFSGTSNKPWVWAHCRSLLLWKMQVTKGSIQFRESHEVNVRRKIEKDKGSKFYINDKEVRARDAQMFFADLSTGAHSLSMITKDV